MSSMIFGETPAFEDVVGSPEGLETTLNAPERGEVRGKGHAKVQVDNLQAADSQS